jgi:hypothetical protein
VYNGAGASPPGAFRGTIACRLVTFQKGIWVTRPFNIIEGYITYDSGIVAAGQHVVDPPNFSIDPRVGSVIEEITSGSRYSVLAIQFVDAYHGGPYRRAWLIAEQP